MHKNVAVIGAGLSGLTAIKQLLDERHDVTCFEQAESLGGVFRGGATYDSVRLTVSNYFMAFSDLLPTDERLKFWSESEYRRYLEKYASKYHLARHVELGTEVLEVCPEPGGWRLVTRRGAEKTERRFNAVAVCSGMFQRPRVPAIDGLDSFEGRVWHARDYRNAEPFKGRHVLCIGMGESSADITSEISQVAASCTLSLRRHPAIAPRCSPFQLDPYFTIDTSLITSRIMNYLPSAAHVRLIQGSIKRYRRSHDASVRCRGEWDAKAGPTPHQVVTKNERIFRHIVDGQVEPNMTGIAEVTRDHVRFNDGTERQIDCIVCCTGFETHLPFLRPAIDNTRTLYKQMFHPQLGASLALIGFARPQQGGIPAVAEMQSRYFAQLCSGAARLPSRQQMVETAKREGAHWEREYWITPHVTSLVNYCHYIDSLARLVGCEPEIPRLLDDPGLHLRLWFGPQFGAQYRLRGPHATPEDAKNFLRSFPLSASPKQIAWFLLLRMRSQLLPFIPSFAPRSL